MDIVCTVLCLLLEHNKTSAHAFFKTRAVSENLGDILLLIQNKPNSALNIIYFTKGDIRTFNMLKVSKKVK